MIKEFFKKYGLVSAAALALMAIGSDAKADFFQWYVVDDIAHNGDFRTMCFEINAYDQVMNGGSPVPEINCGFHPGVFRIDLVDYRIVNDTLGSRCFAYSPNGVLLNFGRPVDWAFCVDGARLERERNLREWRQAAERSRIIRMQERARLERERLERERQDRERRDHGRDRHERREEHRNENRGPHFEIHLRLHTDNDDPGVEDTGGVKSFAPTEQDLHPGSGDQTSKERAI